ncbi:MAG: Uma2 family endonuclease [Leptolyngbya sp.]|nr:Uma2 family endonuclease [Leptolyngbya sp.]
MAYVLSSAMHHNSIYYARIVRNAMGLMAASCRGSFYEVLPRGLQVWLPETGLGVYPDLAVIAGEPLFHEGYANRLTNPCLLFEVLSEPTQGEPTTTEAFLESSRNFSLCRHIPYLQEYVFIHQHSAKVAQYYRATDDDWELTTYEGLDAILELHLTDTRLPLIDLYEGVAFEHLV